MRLFMIILLVILIILSLAAGAAKITQMADDVRYLHAVGLTKPLIILFGLLQLAGGIMLIFPQIRRTGALIALVTFLISSIVIFLSGAYIFGVISLIPAILAAVFIDYGYWRRLI
tara:strand:- start:1278 stop:1622 length:345 start_codon:yes stop_codon:yes gene_type:complete